MQTNRTDAADVRAIQSAGRRWTGVRGYDGRSWIACGCLRVNFDRPGSAMSRPSSALSSRHTNVNCEPPNGHSANEFIPVTPFQLVTTGGRSCEKSGPFGRDCRCRLVLASLRWRSSDNPREVKRQQIDNTSASTPPDHASLAYVLCRCALCSAVLAHPILLPLLAATLAITSCIVSSIIHVSGEPPWVSFRAR